MSDHPQLIVVTGRPGAGKTTLAHRLAEAVRCPLVSRDAIKEGYIRTLGDVNPTNSEIGKAVYEAFFATVTLLLEHRVSVLAEAAFQHKLWQPRLAPLLEIAQVKILVCALDAERAAQRAIARGQADPMRRRYHDDSLFHAALAPVNPADTAYLPPQLDVPTLSVDTTNDYLPDFEKILRFLNQA